jgi:hypothetical protein
MSRLWFTGFEQDSLLIFDAVSGAPTVSTSNPRTATYCLATPGNANTNRGQVNISALPTEIFLRVYARTVSNTPAATSVWFRISDGDGVVLLDITENGDVWLGAVTVGVNKGNAGALTTAYQMYEVRFLVDNAAGLLDVWVDGVSQVSDSGIDTREGAVDTVGFFYIGDVNGIVANDGKRFDDIAINDTSGSINNSWCGQGAVVGCVPIADGTTTEFSLFPDTGEDSYEDIDERPPNSDTDYVFATAVEQDDLYDMTDLESTYSIPRATQVRAVAWWFFNKLVYNGDGEIAPLHAQLGFLQEMPAIACTELAYDYAMGIREENSITSDEFIAGDIDDSEFGFRSKAP